MWTKSKLTKIQKIVLCFLIVANLLAGGYVLYSRQFKTMAKQIPASELIGNAVIRKRIGDLLAKNQTQQIAVVLLTSASTVCSTGKIIDVLKNSAQQSNSEKFVIFLPNHFSQQDVENFKANFNLSFKVEKADDELSQQWLPLASKYEALGVVIISDNEEVSVLQDTNEIENHLAAF